MKQFNLADYKAIRKEPYKVPEKYFDDFTGRLMEQIPADPPVVTTRRHKTLWGRLVRPAIGIAAAVGALVFSITLYDGHHTDPMQTSAVQSQQLSAQETANYVDDFCNFARINDQDFYACVTSSDLSESL